METNAKQWKCIVHEGAVTWPERGQRVRVRPFVTTASLAGMQAKFGISEPAYDGVLVDRAALAMRAEDFATGHFDVWLKIRLDDGKDREVTLAPSHLTAVDVEVK